MVEFDSKVSAVLNNVEQPERKKNIVLLDRSAFYPTSGGQVHDKGSLKIGEKEYDVYNVEKVGRCVLHYLSAEVEDAVIGKTAHGKIDV